MNDDTLFSTKPIVQPLNLEMSSALEDTSTQSESFIESDSPEFSHKTKKKIFLTIGVFILILLIFGALTAGVAYAKIRTVLQELQSTEGLAQEVYDSVKKQNLISAKEKLQKVDEQFSNLEKMYQGFAFVNYVPFARAYYQDGQHMMNAGRSSLEAAEITVQALEPYADVLGFQGNESVAGDSAENRIQLALETLDKIYPILDDLKVKLESMHSELSFIDESRYPEQVKGMVIREKIRRAKEFSFGAIQVVTKGKPVLEVLSDITGTTGGRKKYLVIFQNDKELRSTGGFMTAYASLFIENGILTQEKSDDIYEIDKKFKNKPEIPKILKTYLTTEKKWNLRDMNISPDFQVSMDTFWEYFSQVPGESHDINGIIALDTIVLENLVEILGPIEVPGYGTFTAENDKRCDCPQIIYALSEIVDRPTPYLRENRKGIIGPMMQAILSKAYSAPKQQWPALFQGSWKNIQAKHVQFYFFDEKAQKAAETVNAAGRVKPTPEGSDYLFVVDTNLGGAKSNMFVTTSREQEVFFPENGVVKKTITLTYKNPFPPSNCNLEAGELCLNGKLTDWLRLYLPKEAVIQESLGFDSNTTKSYEELGHAVFEGVFTLQPLGQVKVRVTYTVPYEDTQTYKVFLQKQGGTEPIVNLMKVHGGENEVILDQDKSVEIQF